MGEETRGEERKKCTSEDFDRIAVQHDMRKEMEKGNEGKVKWR
jgi:hypothetical protein